jgi:hypothetical protein
VKREARKENEAEGETTGPVTSRRGFSAVRKDLLPPLLPSVKPGTIGR